MAVYVLEAYNTDSRYPTDIRYREYTTSEKRAGLFRKIPKIPFSDSGHGICFSATEHKGHRLPRQTQLSTYVCEQMSKLAPPKTEKPKRQLDLLFGVLCPDNFKLITIHITGTKGHEVATVRYDSKPCQPAPFRGATHAP